MLALREDLDEPQRREPLKVHAGRRRRDVGETASSVLVRARPSRTQYSIRARAGSPMAAATGATAASGSYIHDLMVNESCGARQVAHWRSR